MGGTAVITTWSRITLGLFVFAVINANWVRQGNAQNDRAAPVQLAASTESAHPLDPALKLAQDCYQYSQANVRDYTAMLTKRTRVDGVLGEQQHVFVKIRNRRGDQNRLTTPMSVYLKFLHPASVKGREVIWVEGQNNGQLVAHEAGLKNLFSLNLDPNGSIAMRGQRYPITEVGMDKLLLQLLEKGGRDRKHGECEVKFYQNAKINGRPCQLVQIVHPVPRSHFEFHRAQVFFDEELKLPIRYASWSWPTEPNGQPLLEEEYTYTQIKTNVGLTDNDFDPGNAEYNF